MKADKSSRTANPSRAHHAGLSQDLLDREIDGMVRTLMMQSPPPRVYPAVMQAIRRQSVRRRNLQATIIPLVGVATATLLLMMALGPVRQISVRAEPAPLRVMALLTWISNTGVARWVNESESIFGYPGILFLHTFGLAMVVGLSIAVNVRLLGVAPRVPAPSLRRLFPYIWFGFWVNAVSGVLLFVASAPRKALNPLFEIKLALVALGVVVMSLIHRQLVRMEMLSEVEPEYTRHAKLLALVSLMIWFAAIAAGRLLAYVPGN